MMKFIRNIFTEIGIPPQLQLLALWASVFAVIYLIKKAADVMWPEKQSNQ